MPADLHDIHSERVAGPAADLPLILGHRGAPLEAPENTLASLRRALELGLDGFEYDLQRCASGEAVLLHDETLERTTDGNGPIESRTLPELYGLDAGSWFHKSFAGEPLPLFDDALELGALERERKPLHMVEIKNPGLVPEVARALRERTPMPVLIASFHRDVVLEARAAGLKTMLLAVHASERDRDFVANERIDAHGLGPGGWRAPAGSADWPCERWSWSVDSPEDLLEACRAPFSGINTNEGPRALAVRELVRLAPRDREPYPVVVGELVVEPASFALGRGEWCGSWRVPASVRNPFEFAVRVECELAVRQGAFELGSPPQPFDLAPGAQRDFELELTGGSFSPGGDPLLLARYQWRNAAGRRVGELSLDAPLARVRLLRARMEALRVPMLRERPGEREASMTVKRVGRDLLVSLENTGGLEEARVIVHFAGDVVRGAKGVRAKLPLDFDARPGGVSFSLGFEGRDANSPGKPWSVRRWAGGIPGDARSGVPGRLLPG